MADKYPKVYAEKLLYLKEGRYSPMHFHGYKTEDIINRGGCWKGSRSEARRGHPAAAV